MTVRHDCERVMEVTREENEGEKGVELKERNLHSSLVKVEELWMKPELGRDTKHSLIGRHVRFPARFISDARAENSSNTSSIRGEVIAVSDTCAEEDEGILRLDILIDERLTGQVAEQLEWEVFKKVPIEVTPWMQNAENGRQVKSEACKRPRIHNRQSERVRYTGYAFDDRKQQKLNWEWLQRQKIAHPSLNINEGGGIRDGTLFTGEVISLVTSESATETCLSNSADTVSSLATVTMKHVWLPEHTKTHFCFIIFILQLT